MVQSNTITIIVTSPEPSWWNYPQSITSIGTYSLDNGTSSNIGVTNTWTYNSGSIDFYASLDQNFESGVVLLSSGNYIGSLGGNLNVQFTNSQLFSALGISSWQEIYVVLVDTVNDVRSGIVTLYGINDYADN